MIDYLTGFGEVFGEYRYDVLSGFLATLQLTLYAAVGSLVLGTVLALMRVGPAPSLRAAGAAYVNVVRNTPLTVVIVFCSLGLWGQLDVVLANQSVPGYIATNSFRLAVLGLSVYTAAFVCEALRSGVNTVPRGQAEAARAVGLGFLATMRLVILPQAARGAIAPLGNTLIALTKNTTVAQAAGVVQASSVMNTMIEFRPDFIVAIFLLFALGFVAIVLPMGLATTALSRRLAVAR
ncbi:amino acid ABC transporter permease [Georgenia faecalis]|uniref:Amino acid ABC transporter permease n=1 Tax=Georgenia faecalis TaxID=2483799 RepID=A0ABV9DCA7_9MICO|nr:amino acid ABC transporter permease [Georgenia faecalis]